jgi:hypothetical protein
MCTWRTVCIKWTPPSGTILAVHLQKCLHLSNEIRVMEKNLHRKTFTIYFLTFTGKIAEPWFAISLERKKPSCRPLKIYKQQSILFGLITPKENPFRRLIYLEISILVFYIYKKIKHYILIQNLSRRHDIYEESWLSNTIYWSKIYPVAQGSRWRAKKSPCNFTKSLC